MSQRQTGEPEPIQNLSQHTNHSDHATEYSTNGAPRRRTPRPDRTEYSTQNTIYSSTPLPPAQCHDETRDPQQQQQVTALIIEAVKSRDDHAHDEQRLTDSNNTSDKPSDEPAAKSQMSTHGSIMDVDATSDPPRRQRAPPTLPSGLDIHGGTMDLDDDPVRNSIQCVLQSATGAPAPQRPTWSLYGALDAGQRQKTAAADRSPDPRAYAQRIRR